MVEAAEYSNGATSRHVNVLPLRRGYPFRDILRQSGDIADPRIVSAARFHQMIGRFKAEEVILLLYIK